MNKELDKKLCEEFPDIFKNRHGDMQTTAMCWGFECGDGWYNIIHGLCLSLKNNYMTSKDLRADGRPLPEDMDIDNPEFASYFWHHAGTPNVIATQVKEKYGSLRFYYCTEWSEKDKKMAELYPNTARIIADEQYRFIEGLICMAETMSMITCEETGKIGEMHSTGGSRGGWYKTLNRDFAKTDEWCISRNYLPVADTPNEEVKL
jgi:hypothetical protein